MSKSLLLQAVVSGVIGYGAVEDVVGAVRIIPLVDMAPTAGRQIGRGLQTVRSGQILPGDDEITAGGGDS